jgi:trimeric autotransporter adhesin
LIDTVLLAPVNQFSDIRLKADVQDLVDALSVIQNLSGRKYYWKDDLSTLERDAPGISRGGLKTVGVIAQEVQRVLPEAVEVTNEGFAYLNQYLLVWVTPEFVLLQLALRRIYRVGSCAC